MPMMAQGTLGALVPHSLAVPTGAQAHEAGVSDAIDLSSELCQRRAVIRLVSGYCGA
jgi:hypothetical protein